MLGLRQHPVHANQSDTTRPQAADRDAIARLRAGDVSALDILYHRHAGTLLQLATRLLGSRPNAEDVVHDVFVSVVSAARTFGRDGDVGAWLRTMTINRCIDRTRTSARRDALALQLVPPSQTPETTRDVIAAERIEQAIAELPAAVRMVFVLRALEGRTHPEIAKALGIRVGTSEVRYHRAVRALRTALGDLR